MKRIYSIDFLKLVFAYVIAFFHFGTTISPGPTITVQIFFIISGFFLARKFYSRSHADHGESYDQWNYTLDHVKSLYPQYLFSLVVFFLYTLARSVLYFFLEPTMDKLSAIALDFYNQIPDLFLLQSTYRFHESYNYPLWQVSALLIAGYFVYGLLCRSEKLSRKLIFPAAILMITSLLYTGVDIWGNVGPFYVPLLRAFSPLCIGVLAYYFTTTPYYELVKRKKTAFNLAVILSLISIFVFEDHANIFLLTTVILIWGCWDETSWLNRLLNRKIFKHFGSLSFAVYCNHALIARFLQARVIPRVDLAPWLQNGMYFVLLTVYSVFTLFLVEKWKARRAAKKAVMKGA